MGKREKLEEELNNIGLVDYVLFGEYEGESVVGVWGDGTKIVNTVLEALEKDWKLRAIFIGMLQGLIEQQTANGQEGKA